MSTADRLVDNLTEEFESVVDENKNTLNESKAEVPQKFAGKSIEDVISSYQNLERDYGRQGQELGQLRGHVDQLLQTTIQKQNTAVEEKEAPSFYDDPENYISRVLEEKLAPLVGRVDNTEQAQTVNRLNEIHPNWQETVNSSEFHQWVSQSPIRLELHAKANQADYNAGKELLDNWDLQQKVSQTTTNATQEQKLKDATTETGSTGQTGGRKVYKRHDLIQLRLNDPNKYESMESEIMQAYAEGRVKN
tara:strand:- start:671 stop:1417 length:747 start_codon:yes stop_codon:yes gene_type:complete